MTCQRRYIDSSRCATLMWDVDMGQVVHVWGQGVYGNALYFAQFCCELKLLLKVKGILKRIRKPLANATGTKEEGHK